MRRRGTTGDTYFFRTATPYSDQYTKPHIHIYTPANIYLHTDQHSNKHCYFHPTSGYGHANTYVFICTIDKYAYSRNQWSDQYTTTSNAYEFGCSANEHANS